MTMLVLVIMAGILTFFAFKTPQVLFRLGAAVGWLTLLLYVLSSDKSVDISNPWTVSLFMCLFCTVVAILLLYMGKTIERGWIVNKETKVKDDYRDTLRKRLSKVDRGGYGGKRR